MIKKRTGNLLLVERGYVVHGCNTLGIMGAGLAKAVKDVYPEAYAAYRKQFLERGLFLGEIITVPVDKPPQGLPHKFIVNAMTQDRLAKYDGEFVVSYEAIGHAFERIRELAVASQLPVHVPLIGCGLAGGKWSEVAPIIDAALGNSVEKYLWVL